MDNIPVAIRGKLASVGYTSIDELPNDKDMGRWNAVKTDCGLTPPERDKLMNIRFPQGSASVPSPSTPAVIKDWDSVWGKQSASDFAASKCNPFLGFGMRGHALHFDPTAVEEDPRLIKLQPLFTRSAETEAEKRRLHRVHQDLSRSVLVYNDLSKVSETISDDIHSLGRGQCVQRHHLDILRIASLHTVTSAAEKTLLDNACGRGLATEDSKPDGIFVDQQGHARGIAEAKNGTDSVCEAMRQSSSEGSNIAVMQLELGVPWQEVIVPVIGTNGHEMQFGAVIVLEPSFPVFVAVSSVLDLTDEQGLKTAALLLLNVTLWVETTLKIGTTQRIEKMSLSRVVYHHKPVNAFFSCTGNLQTSLLHHWRVLARLHCNNQSRPYVLFPICVREYGDDSSQTALIFPNLAPQYRIGLPEEPDLRQSYLQEVRDAMGAFHEAGVVHLDFYPSNIMWRKTESSVKIKVIDWDSAQLRDEEMWPECRTRLVRSQYRFPTFEKSALQDGVTWSCDGAAALTHFDISLVKVLELSLDDESLRTSDKAALDKAFKAAQGRYCSA